MFNTWINKHKNMCELCDIILEKDKEGTMMVKQSSVLHERFLDVFHELF